SLLNGAEVEGPNGDRGISNISGTEFKCGTVQVRFVRFAGQVYVKYDQHYRLVKFRLLHYFLEHFSHFLLHFQRKIHIEQLSDSSLLVRLVESLMKSPTLNLVVCPIVEKLTVCSIVEHLVVVPIVELAGVNPTAEH
ncbi:hypothetical protein HID58_011343, partial [Brassica napus]